METALRELIAKWRAASIQKHYTAAGNRAFNQCADELESLLGDAPATELCGCEYHRSRGIACAASECRSREGDAPAAPASPSLRSLLIDADSYLSLLWHRHVPPDRKPFDLAYEVESVIGRLRKATEALPPAPQTGDQP